MKKIQWWLRLLLSSGLVVFLLYTVDVGETLAVLIHGQPIYLFLAFIIALGDRVLMAYKWTLLLKPKGIRLPMTSAIGTYWVSSFLGVFLPATVGSDALRVYAVVRGGYGTADVISSIVIERALGFIALFTFVLVSIILSIAVFGQHFFSGMWNLFGIFAALLMLCTAAVYLSLNTAVLRRLNTAVVRRGVHVEHHKFVAKARELYQSYAAYRHYKATLFTFLALSLIETLFPLFWTYFLALAFNIHVPLLYFFILVPITLVLVRLPISLDGFGIQEGAFVYFLGLIGVARSEAFSLGLGSHILAIVSLLPGGLLYSVCGLSMLSQKPGRESVSEVQ